MYMWCKCQNQLKHNVIKAQVTEAHHASEWGGLGSGQRIWIPSKFLDETDGTVGGTALRKPLPYTKTGLILTLAL